MLAPPLARRAARHRFTPMLQVYFKARNPSFPIQREFYDVTYEAGVKVRL